MVSNKKRPTKQLSDTDIDLFRNAIGEVTPVENDRIHFERKRPEPVPTQSLADEQAVIHQLGTEPFDVPSVDTGDELSFLRPGIQKQTLRKLKRGLIAIQDELDLHGMVVTQANTAVKDFLQRSTQRGAYAVRIIHGKGRGSRNQLPVLKNRLNHWLQLDDRVLAFCSARPIDGGTGAVYVLLKRSSQ